MIRSSWDGFRFISSLHTGDDGKIRQTVNHGYHYEKTFCDGHQNQRWLKFRRKRLMKMERYRIRTRGSMKLRRKNERLQEDWQACIEACEDYADQVSRSSFSLDQ